MKYREFVKRFSFSMDISRHEAKRIVELLVALVNQSVAEEKVLKLHNLGTFYRNKVMRQKRFVNPNPGAGDAVLMLSEIEVLRFKPAKHLRKQAVPHQPGETYE